MKRSLFGKIFLWGVLTGVITACAPVASVYVPVYQPYQPYRDYGYVVAPGPVYYTYPGYRYHYVYYSNYYVAN